MRDFDHPTTRVRFVWGDAGTLNAQAQGTLYFERLMEVPTNDVTLRTVPGPHGVHTVTDGANALRDLILGECAPL